MFFRNLTLFRFPTSLDFSQLDDLLPEAALKPVGPLELSSRGFISPFGRGEEALSHRINDAIWLSVGGEDKILPGAVVNDLLQKKLLEIEEKEGRKPGGKTRKRLKDDLLHELLPRAFVKPSRTDALVDLEHGFIAVDASSRKTGENVVSEVRRALGSFPALPLNAEVAPRSVLTGWIAGEPLPEGLSLGEECELKDAMEGGAVVKCQNQELRIDFENRPSHEVLRAKLKEFAERLPECDAVVFSDYGKGGLTHIGEMIQLARTAGKVVLVDPKGDDYSAYRGATIITPNRSEMREVVGRWKDEADLERRATELRERLELGALLVTRSEEGMSLFLPGRTIHEKAVAREVFDVSGAGDTVIATLAVMAAHGADWADAIHVANVAAGIVVGKLGTAVVTRDELAAALN